MIESINIESIITAVNLSGWLVALFVGGLAGFVYFFGLWLTLKQLPVSKNPGLLMLSSLLLRMAFVMSVFYLIMLSVGWQGLLIALVGLTLVRLILSRRYKPEALLKTTTNAANAAVDSAKPI